MSEKKPVRKFKAKPAIVAAEAASAPAAPTVLAEEIAAAPETAVAAVLAAEEAEAAPIHIEPIHVEPAPVQSEPVQARPEIKIEERTISMTETLNQTAQTITDRTQAAFGEFNSRAKEQMGRSTKIVEEMTDLTRGNVEAFVTSSKVAARGFETIAQDVAEFGRRSFEDASSTVKSFAEVRSATDLFRLQSEFARTAFDNMVSESSKVSEAMIKLAGEVAEPITSRYSIAAERVKNIAA